MSAFTPPTPDAPPPAVPAPPAETVLTAEDIDERDRLEEEYYRNLPPPSAEEIAEWRFEQDAWQHFEEQDQRWVDAMPPFAVEQFLDIKQQITTQCFDDDNTEVIGNECLICLETQMGYGETVATCGHSFHTECITKWLLKRKDDDTGFNDNCPKCRKEWVNHPRPREDGGDRDNFAQHIEAQQQAQEEAKEAEEAAYDAAQQQVLDRDAPDLDVEWTEVGTFNSLTPTFVNRFIATMNTEWMIRRYNNMLMLRLTSGVFDFTMTHLTRQLCLEVGYNYDTDLTYQTFPTCICKEHINSILRGLSVESCELETIPDDINILTNLTSLNVSNNRMEDGSLNIAALTRLTRLDLSKNWFDELPDLSTLTSLKSLECSGYTVDESETRFLYNIPASIGNLTQLEYFDIAIQRVRSLPDEIYNLRNLRTLNINDNKIESLSEAIGQLTMLSDLFVSYNRLTCLPDSITNLEQLRRFGANNNRLTPAGISSRVSEFLERLRRTATNVIEIEVNDVYDPIDTDEDSDY